MTHLVTGELRIQTTIECRVCGRTAFGDPPNRIELRAEFYKDIPNLIARHQRNHLVEPPVGWSVSGNGNYDCPEHIK
jgi:hypothetical protein